MSRLYIVVEGQTEETFVNEVLYPHLQPLSLYISPINLDGIKPYQAVRRVISYLIKQHGPSGVHVTTMLDLYALPPDVPGFTTNTQTPNPYSRVEAIEAAIKADIDYYRFIPYVQLHEFEALLFSDVAKIGCQYPDQMQGIEALAREINQFSGPEYVNDGPDTAPSKRIKEHIPNYDKVFAGSLTAMDIGLPRMREQCPHFGQWLSRLEEIAQEDVS